MDKFFRIGLVCFSLSYIALELSAAWLLTDEGWLATDWGNCFVISALVALCSVLIGLATGRLTVPAVAICSLLIQAAAVAVTIVIYVELSSRRVGTIVWPPLMSDLVARVWLSWLAEIVAGVFWPTVCLLGIRWLSPRLVIPTRS